MSEKNVLSKVTPTILAEHHPAITRVFPHKQTPKAVKRAGWVPVERCDYYPDERNPTQEFFGKLFKGALRSSLAESRF